MRVRSGVARRRSKKRLFKEARGNYAGRGKLLRTVKETVIKSRAYAYRDRKTRKRVFRQLWITRISGACMQRGTSYSSLINGLTKAEVSVNRKMLSELAIFEPAIFDELVEIALKAIAEKKSA
jgi:large subunit ribosomal protein L20